MMDDLTGGGNGGERATGTPNTIYDLSSVLFHALQEPVGMHSDDEALSLLTSSAEEALHVLRTGDLSVAEEDGGDKQRR